MTLAQAADKLTEALNTDDAYCGTRGGTIIVYVNGTQVVAAALSKKLGTSYEGFPLEVEHLGKIKKEAL